MIVTLAGQITEKFESAVVLEAAGVGYGVFVSSEDFGRLQTGQEVRLHIYEHIREQAHDLFGFLERDTKQLFEQLLEVNGVGPKMALNVLSIGTPGEVRIAIANGDTKFISRATGVGKRVAERIVVELKDKVGLPSVTLASTGLLQSDTVLMQDEAVEALIVLGFSPQDASAALQSVDESLTTEERVKQALKRGK